MSNKRGKKRHTRSNSMDNDCDKENVNPNKKIKMDKKAQLEHIRQLRHDKNYQKKKEKDELYREAMKEYANPEGRTRPEGENKLIIQALCYWRLEGLNQTQSIKKVREMFGGSNTTHLKLWKNWEKTGEVEYETEKRGRKETVIWDICEAEDKSDKELAQLLAEFAFDRTIKNPTGFTRPELHSFLNTQGINFEQHVLDELLEQYNFYWQGDDVTYKENLNNLARIESKKETLYKISHALQLEDELVGSGSEAKNSDEDEEDEIPKKRFMVGSLDQTWANMGTNMELSWIHDCGDRDPDKCKVCFHFNKIAGKADRLRTQINKRGKGKRMAIQHVVTRLKMMNQFVVYHVQLVINLMFNN